MLKLCLIEMDRPKIPCFWKTENLLYVVASVDRNQERNKRSVQHENCSIICLFNPSGFSEQLDEWKTEFMLENYELVSVHLRRSDGTLCL